MAAAPKAWGLAAANTTNWADHVDEEEEAGNLAAPLPVVEKFAAGPKAQPIENDFPSLGEAAKAPNPKTAKKKKPMPMPLNQFNSLPAGKLSGSAAFRPSGMTGGGQSDKDILASLPTAPRPREAGEDDGERGMGGGFKEYGGDRGGRGGFDREPRGGDRNDRPPRRDDGDAFTSSKADAVDDWGTTRTFTPSGGAQGGFGRQGGGGGFGDGGGRERPVREGPTADDVDDWGSSRKFEPSAGDRRGGGGGFGGSGRDAPGGFDGRGPTRADDEDEWSKGRTFQPSEGARGAAGGGGRSFGGDARGAGDNEDRWSKREAPPPSVNGGSSQPAERPRLQLAPRSKPLDPPPAAVVPPTEERPVQPPAVRPVKSNPFGAARPREEVLKEKGIDVATEELKLETAVVHSPPREETPEEVAVKAEVEKLQNQLEALKASGPDPESIADEVATVTAELDAKEHELHQLTAELDVKAKYAKRTAAERVAGGGGGEEGAAGAEKEAGAAGWGGGAARGAGGDRFERGGDRSAGQWDRSGPPAGRGDSRDAGRDSGRPGSMGGRDGRSGPPRDTGRESRPAW